jgi:uncharacterized protein DUF6444
MAARLEAVEAENVELKARLGQNSQNSSKPPSSDLGGTRPPQGKRGKRRKRGGQPGRLGRFAAEPDHVDEVKQYRACTCEHCGADLADGKLTGSVVSHFVYGDSKRHDAGSVQPPARLGGEHFRRDEGVESLCSVPVKAAGGSDRRRPRLGLAATGQPPAAAGIDGPPFQRSSSAVTRPDPANAKRRPGSGHGTSSGAES